MSLILVCFCAGPAGAYSLLTHEQLIDLTWNDSIVPLLQNRYPTLTPAQLEEARAFAYGGCVIQDIGYYPFGDELFSNLTHYVRSGDFVVDLFRNASNADELAFAIGALSHYIGDSEGHSLATNRAVPVEFPELARKFGGVVNYAQGKTQHVRTEFAFDINELSQRRMAPFRYQKHIGLAVPVKQLALAYYQTYGLTRGFTRRGEQRINLGAYRFAVRSFIPRIARAIAILHKQLEPADPHTKELVELRKEVAAVAASGTRLRHASAASRMSCNPCAMPTVPMYEKTTLFSTPSFWRNDAGAHPGASFAVSAPLVMTTILSASIPRATSTSRVA